MSLSLPEAAESINTQIDSIICHETDFQHRTLIPRLLIGQACAHAKAQFGFENWANLTANEVSNSLKNRVAQRATEPESRGFSGWLRHHCPRLPRKTAEKYINAWHTLGLPQDTDSSLIAAAVLSRCSPLGLPPSLSSLIKIHRAQQGKAPLSIPSPIPDSPEARANHAREAIELWKIDFEQRTGRSLDHLDRPALMQFHQFILGIRDQINARLKSHH